MPAKPIQAGRRAQLHRALKCSLGQVPPGARGPGKLPLLGNESGPALSQRGAHTHAMPFGATSAPEALMMTTIDVNRMVPILQVDVYLEMATCNSYRITKCTNKRPGVKLPRPERRETAKTTQRPHHRSGCPCLGCKLYDELTGGHRVVHVPGGTKGHTTFSLSVHHWSSPHRAQTCQPHS